MMQSTFQITQAMTASQADLNLLATWPPRFPASPTGAVLVSILINATTAGVRLVVSAGTRLVQPRSQVQGGGTAGTMPNPLGTAAIQFIAYNGEEIQPLLTEVLAGTPSVNLLVTTEAVAA